MSAARDWKRDVEKAVEKSKVVELNKQIALHANRKQLSEAMTLFEEAVQKDWANSHTFSAAINANIRCGSVEGAASLFQRLRTTKGLKMDVITCTTMMKGFCSEGDVRKALNLFDEMKVRNVPPNIRTFNTFLRACVTIGEVDQAETMVLKMQKEYRVQPDISAWEYLVVLLCQGLRLDKVQPIVGRLRSDQSLLPDLGAIYVNTARAASILGDWKACRKALAGAKEAIELNEARDRQEGQAAAEGSDDGEGDDDDNEDLAQAVQQMSKKIQSTMDKLKDASESHATASSSEVNNKREATGGRKAWKSSAEEDSDPRAQSLAMFKEHRRAELKRELTTIEEFMQKQAAVSISSSDNNSKASYVLPYFRRVFSFPPENTTAVDSSSGVEAGSGVAKDGASLPLAAKLVRALQLNFGLSACIGKSSGSGEIAGGASKGQPKPTASDGGAGGKSVENRPEDAVAAAGKERAAKSKAKPKKNSATSAKSDGAKTTPTIASKTIISGESSSKNYLAEFTDAYSSTIDSSGRIDFDAVFARSDLKASATAAEEAQQCKQGPLKIEICSGAGEWAVSQAKADKESRWVTLELRHDRVYQTFSRAVFSGADNLCVIGGDATQILPNHLRPNSVQYVYVNHPEPPQQTGGSASQGKHLLTPAFLQEISRILCMDGLLTIVTDNLWYARFLMKEFAYEMNPRVFSSATLESLEASLASAAAAASTVAKDNMAAVVTPGPTPAPKPSDVISSQSATAAAATAGTAATAATAAAAATAEDPVTSETSTSTAVNTTKSKLDRSKEKKEKRKKNKGLKRGREDETSIDLENFHRKGVWNFREEAGGIKLYEGRPGLECGVAVDASSYFDRLWKREKLVERYFLVLRKGATELKLAGPARKSGSVVVKTSSNKKIKFDN